MINCLKVKSDKYSVQLTIDNFSLILFISASEMQFFIRTQDVTSLDFHSSWRMISLMCFSISTSNRFVKYPNAHQPS